MNKKILFLVFTAVCVFTSCDERLAKEFQNPERHNPRPEEIIPGMLNAMITSRFYELDYGEWWWTFRSGFGIPAYAQVSTRRPHPSETGNFNNFSVLDGTNMGFYSDMRPAMRFGWYYNELKNWGLLRDEIATLSGSDLDDNEVYFLAAGILKCAIGLQMVDIYDNIPYSEAFQGTEGLFFPKFDKGRDVYVTILDELAELAAQIPSSFNRMSARAKETFDKMDFAFSGDAQKWVQYANSVRLRHAVRMSGVEPDIARKHIAEVIPNLPKVDFIYPITRRNENRVGNEGGGIYSRALYENSVSTLIPNIIMQRMNYDEIDYVEGEDDPRLPVIACPTRYTKEDPDNYQFTGMSMNYDAQYPYWPTQSVPAGVPYIDNGPGLTVRTFVNNVTDITLWLRSCYSQYNIGTYIFGNIPSYMNSLAENDLFLAEIAAKGLGSTGKSAGEHIRDAVIHSTDFWYYINSQTNIWNTPGMPDKDDFLTKAFQPAKPSVAVIEQFADKIKAEYEAVSGIEDQMEIIMQQKYIHHNILNIFELWAELRRTHHPKLEIVKVNDVPHVPMPQRVKYHPDETTRNYDNYKEIILEDTYLHPIFWVPDNKRNSTYYWIENGEPVYLPLKGFLPLPDPNPNRPAPAQ